MKKTILLLAAAGLGLAACGSHGAANDTAANSDVVVNDTGDGLGVTDNTGEALPTDGALGNDTLGNTLGNGSDAGNAAAPAGNAG